MFDYGPGVQDHKDQPVRDLSKIFNRHSYRKRGVAPDGRYHSGGSEEEHIFLRIIPI